MAEAVAEAATGAVAEPLIVLRRLRREYPIIIGIASVVSVVAIGEGSRQKVLANISSLGANTLEIFAGKDFGDVRSSKITTLVVADADELAKQPYVAAVTPTVSTSTTVRYGSKESSALVNGVSERYFDAKGRSWHKAGCSTRGACGRARRTSSSTRTPGRRCSATPARTRSAR